MNRHVFASTDALAAELVHLSVDAAAAAVKERGLFSLALTGGSAAEKLYPVLAQAPLPWDKVHVFFGDERCVPPAHADSNFKLAEDTFLRRVGIPAANVHRMRGEDAPAKAAAAYAEELLRVTGDGTLDAVHVGMGPDGHICSLFPGHALLSSQKLVDSLTDSPKPPPSRVTFTLPLLKKARALWFLVMGQNKADAVKAAVLDASSALPAALAARGNDHTTWLLDTAAATHLKSG